MLLIKNLFKIAFLRYFLPTLHFKLDKHMKNKHLEHQENILVQNIFKTY